jgi:DNA-binding NtrC family response regulator
VERAFILSDDEIPTGRFSLEHCNGSDPPEKGLGVRVGMPIPEMERRLILATLERHRGDKKKAAETLGISLKTLYNRLSIYRASAQERSASRTGPDRK